MASYCRSSQTRTLVDSADISDDEFSWLLSRGEVAVSVNEGTGHFGIDTRQAESAHSV